MGGCAKRYNPLGKVLKLSYKINHIATLWHNNSLSRCLHKRNKNMFTKDLYKNIHNTQNIQLSKTWNSPGDFQQGNGQWGIFIQQSMTQQKKSSKCNMYESQDYGEWSLTKEHILYNSMYMQLKNKENVYVWEKNWNKGCLQEMGVGINWKRAQDNFAA